MMAKVLDATKVAQKSFREENFETLKRILGADKAVKALSTLIPNTVGTEFELTESNLTVNSARLFTDFEISQCIGKKFKVVEVITIFKQHGKWSTTPPIIGVADQMADVPSKVEPV